MIINFLFVLCLVGISNCAFIDTLEKCHIHNGDVCNKNNLLKIIKDLSKTGLPEYNIPPLDPLHLTDLKVSILNVMELTFIDGIVKGFKNCLVNKHKINFESKRVIADLTCDMTAKGRYKAFSSGDVVKNLFGEEQIHGDGNGKVKIEKLHVVFEFDFELKNRDGDIYIVDTSDKLNYKYEVLGKMLFAADNLYLGNVESSKVITDFLNQNWRPLFDSFGRGVMDTAMEIVHKYTKNFYYNVPTRYFIDEDLTPFVNNQ